jgi:hypothetical protein
MMTGKIQDNRPVAPAASKRWSDAREFGDEYEAVELK